MWKTLAHAEKPLFNFMRIAIFVVMAWIGGLKACQYEADGIVPLVANSPLMSFFYHHKGPPYNEYKNPEGKIVARNIEWHLCICLRAGYYHCTHWFDHLLRDPAS